jgi:hypothetical protein
MPGKSLCSIVSTIILKHGCKQYIIALDSLFDKWPVTIWEWRTGYTNIPKKAFLSVANSISPRPKVGERCTICSVSCILHEQVNLCGKSKVAKVYTQLEDDTTQKIGRAQTIGKAFGWSYLFFDDPCSLTPYLRL